jgi:hypothetical protein
MSRSRTKTEEAKTMATMNYMQRVGRSYCIRCDFETDEAQSFIEQDEAMSKHLAEKHPNWLTEPMTQAQVNRAASMLTPPKIEKGECIAFDKEGNEVAWLVNDNPDYTISKIRGH